MSEGRREGEKVDGKGKGKESMRKTRCEKMLS